MRVLLVSTYELGHQPLHVASPAAALRKAGHEVRCLDLSVERWDAGALEWAQAAGFSVPMHTAMRLAMRAAAGVRRARPELPVCFYGLYAPVSRDLTVGALADRAIAGEYEPALTAWVGELAAGGPPDARADEALIQLGRGEFELPARDLLPPLERYAHLALGGDERLVGYVEASHGCVHRCRHCPVPPVYDGRIRIVGADTVVRDIASLVEVGARHITFGDPDFLNGRRHSLRVVQAMHERFPELTFDCTTKVEHILHDAELWPALAAAGCLFVISAFESVNDEILERLDKGHTTEEAARAIALLREHGIEVRPSWMPFTPWTTPGDVVEMLDFVAEHDLVGNVDPVQYTIRLLLPEGSLLLERPDMRPHLGGYDAERLSYRWTRSTPTATASRPASRRSSSRAQRAPSRSPRRSRRCARRHSRRPGDRRRPPAAPSRSSPARPRADHGSPSRGSAERSPPRASLALSTRCSHPARHRDVTRVRRPAGMGQALFDGSSSDVAPNPDPCDHTRPILRHFQELKARRRGRAAPHTPAPPPPRAGLNPIAVPHTGARFRAGRPWPPRCRSRWPRSFRARSLRGPKGRHEASAIR